MSPNENASNTLLYSFWKLPDLCYCSSKSITSGEYERNGVDAQPHPLRCAAGPAIDEPTDCGAGHFSRGTLDRGRCLVRIGLADRQPRRNPSHPTIAERRLCRSVNDRNRVAVWRLLIASHSIRGTRSLGQARLLAFPSTALMLSRWCSLRRVALQPGRRRENRLQGST